MPPSDHSSRRDFLKVAGAAAALPLASSYARADEAANKRPNVVFLMADQHRADVAGFAGNQHALTPALDALAKRSVQFTNMYCQSPLCVPSRQSLITNSYPHEHGHFANSPLFPEGQGTLAAHLEAHGYDTALIGKAHVNTSEFTHVYDKSAMYKTFAAAHRDAQHPGDFFDDHPAGARLTAMMRGNNPLVLGPGEGNVHFMEEDVVAASREWLMERDDDRPFFLWASFASPHPPRYSPERWMQLFRDKDLPSWGLASEADVSTLFRFMRDMRSQSGIDKLDAEQFAGMLRSYYAAVAWSDHCMGQLIETLDALKLRENTIVVYTADHGDMLGDHGLAGKFAHFEGASHVPCLIDAPSFTSPKRVENVSEHLDLVATLLDLCSVPAYGPNGRSLAPLCGDLVDVLWNDEAMSELYYGPAQEAVTARNTISVMLRQGDYKYWRNSPGEQALFNLAEDPEERRNLAAELPQRVRDMSARIDARLPDEVYVRRKRKRSGG